jgi:UDP-2,4-diacetamido-2,4,6-trideoxy-beta-L-altropyranose hydrolase
MRRGKNFAFRVDASRDIGTGHFMRCLALAAALRKAGDRVRFLSRHASEHLCDLARVNGLEIVVLKGAAAEPIDELAHSRWLATSQRADAMDSIAALSGSEWEWLIVDHYALDVRWETALRTSAKRVMAIDDLADRQHDCDLLLDQNIYPDADTRYSGRTPSGCGLLLGPRYALLREEFGRLHEAARKRDGQVHRILIQMGGVDADNQTEKAIEATAALGKRSWTVDVIVGKQHPALERLEVLCRHHGYTLHVQTTAVAALIAAADLAIGAAGSSSWERCCLGLPTLCIGQAANQTAIARGLQAQGAIVSLGEGAAVTAGAISRAVESIANQPEFLAAASAAARRLVDGRGVERVSKRLWETV